MLLLREEVIMFAPRFLYVLYFIFLIIMGVSVGFLLGLFNRDNQENDVFIFLLLSILHLGLGKTTILSVSAPTTHSITMEIAKNLHQ